MTARRNKPTRRPATRFLVAVDILSAAIERAEVPLTVASELLGTPYITLDKVLRRERNVRDESSAKRMIAVADILNSLVDRGDLPLGKEINYRLRRQAVLGLVEQFITK